MTARAAAEPMLGANSCDTHTLRSTVDSVLDWRYGASNSRLSSLTLKAHEQAWRANDLDWSLDVDLAHRVRGIAHPLAPSAYYNALLRPPMALDDDEAVALATNMIAFMLSQFLHGEQGALLASARVVQAVPTVDAKLYASTQVADEARHVEVYSRYLEEKLEITYPVHPSLRHLIDDILGAGPWDLTVLGMQIIVEGLALAAFNLMHSIAPAEPLIEQITERVARDESRHVAFGVLLLGRAYTSQMTPQEVHLREDFAIHAIHSLHERLLMTPVLERLGYSGDAWHAWVRDNAFMRALRQLLLAKIAPALRSIGLLTPKVSDALKAHQPGLDDLERATDAAWLPREFLGSLRPLLALRRSARRAVHDPSKRG